jgi:predicted MFS family arabinose efflux permease
VQNDKPIFASELVMKLGDSSPKVLDSAGTRFVRQNAGETSKGLAAVMALAIVGNLSVGLAPFIVEGLGHAGLTSAQAGLCISAEMLGFVLGSAALLFWFFNVSRPQIALAALLLVIGGNLLCLPAHGFFTYAGARFIAGIGCGLTTSAYGDLATTLRPERNFAILSGATVVLTSAFGAVAPWLAAQLGTDSLFLLIALLAIAALPSVRLITVKPSDLAEARPFRGTFRLGRDAVTGIAMMLLYFIPLSAYWAYVTQLGVAREADPTTVAEVVSIGFLVSGFGGSLVAMIPALRDKHALVITVAALGGAASVLITCMVPNFFAYAAAVTAFIFFWFLALPFLMGVLSALDPSGRLAISGIIIETIGFVLGPALAGLLIERHSNIAFCAACAVVFAASIICVLAVAPRRGKPALQHR